VVRKVALLVLLACATAHADDKSPETAKYLSGGGAAVSGAILLASFLDGTPTDPFNPPLFYTGLATAAIAPSLGQFYAGEWFTPGMAIRIASAGLAVYAVRNEETTTTCLDMPEAGTQCKQLKGAGVALIGVAAIGFIGGMWYDALDAGDAVNRWRARHGIYVAPTGNGVALGGSF
jgi:hypothetical protein